MFSSDSTFATVFNFKYFLFHMPFLSESVKEMVRFIGETNFM